MILKLSLFPVEKIDHNQKVVQSVSNYDPVKMGKYLSVSCVGCHKDNLKGGESPIPGSPPVPDITSAGKPGKWKLAEFLKTLRTGKTPEGHQMRNQDMPWKMTSHYSDKELEALYYYLKSIK